MLESGDLWSFMRYTVLIVVTFIWHRYSHFLQRQCLREENVVFGFLRVMFSLFPPSVTVVGTSNTSADRCVYCSQSILTAHRTI